MAAAEAVKDRIRMRKLFNKKTFTEFSFQKNSLTQIKRKNDFSSVAWRCGSLCLNQTRRSSNSKKEFLHSCMLNRKYRNRRSLLSVFLHVSDERIDTETLIPDLSA